MKYEVQHPKPQIAFDQTESKRLSLIEQMDRMHESHSRGPLFKLRSRILARKATELSYSPDMYSMQAFDLATRLAALNPSLEKAAHGIIERKFAEKDDMPKPLEELTYLVLEKTVEKSAENDDDTITLPRLVVQADSAVTHDIMGELPSSDLMEKIAADNEAEHEQLKNQPVVSNVVDLASLRKPTSTEAVAVPSASPADSTKTTVIKAA